MDLYLGEKPVEKVLNGEGSADEGEIRDDEEDDDGAGCYNKSKSFFDSISCEALERAKGSATIIAISHKRCIAVPSELKNKR